jgi:hypothetical protein
LLVVEFSVKTEASLISSGLNYVIFKLEKNLTMFFVRLSLISFVRLINKNYFEIVRDCVV